MLMYGRSHRSIVIVLELKIKKKVLQQDFPGGPVVENLLPHVGDMGPILGMGRFHVPRGS